MKDQAQTELVGGVLFVSNADLEQALDEAGASSAVADAAIEANAEARIDGLKSALLILALLALIALFFTPKIPRSPPGSPAPA